MKHASCLGVQLMLADCTLRRGAQTSTSIGGAALQWALEPQAMDHLARTAPRILTTKWNGRGTWSHMQGMRISCDRSVVFYKTRQGSAKAT